MSRPLLPLAPRFFPLRIRFLSACLGLVAFVAPEGRAGLLFHDDFRSTPEGEIPAGWETKDRWRVVHIGDEAVAAQEDETAGIGRPLTKRLAAPTDQSWVLELDHAWAWGGTSSGHGFHSQRFDLEVLDETGSGFRLRMPQGRHLTAPESGLAEPDKLWKLYRLERRKPPVLLAEGSGHDAAGWRTRSLAAPDWHGACLAWDRTSRRLTALRRVNGRWVESISVPGIEAAGISRLVVNPAYFAHSCVPQVGRVTLWTPDQIAWGVSGEADGPAASTYRAVGTAAALRKVKELGLGYYRIDFTAALLRPAETQELEELLAQAREHGVTVLPVLRDAGGLGGPISGLYEQARQRALAFASRHRGRFTHIEIGREFEFASLAAGEAPDSPVTHDEDKLARVMEVLRGLGDGLRAGDPALRRLVGVVACDRPVFVERMIRHRVDFDGLALAWYSEMGSLRGPLEKLSGFGKPIWITEINRTHGASRALWAEDGFEKAQKGKPPEGWVTSGDWRILDLGGSPAATNRDQSAGPGRTLTKVFPREVGTSWSLELRSGWEWGDGGGDKGNHGIWIDYDLLDASGHGYRLRAHQGDSGKEANTNRVLRLFALSPAGATEIAHGAGPNKSGWKSRRLKTPDFARIRVEWDQRAATIAVRHGEAGEEELSFSVGSDRPARFDRLVVRAAMFNHGECPQLGRLRLRVDERSTSEAQQAEVLAAMIEELERIPSPSVQGIVLHELFDRAPAGWSSDSGDHYGLFAFNPTAGGAMVPAPARPVANLIASWTRRGGGLPVLHDSPARVPGDLVPVAGLPAAALDAKDSDGIPTLVKLALGLPIGTPGAVPAVALVDGRMLWEFPRRWPAQIRYRVEASTDGETWAPLATLDEGREDWRGAATVSESGRGPTRRVRVRDTAPIAPGERRMLRLRIGDGEAAAEPAGPHARP